EIDVRVGEFACRYAEDGDRASRSEVHADDRRVLERVDQEEVAVRSRDNRPRIPPRAGGVGGVVNPDLVVTEVDHQFDRAARQNPLPGMRWRVRTKPEAVDALVKRRTRDIGTQEHGHGPQQLGNAAELVVRARLRSRPTEFSRRRRRWRSPWRWRRAATR